VGLLTGMRPDVFSVSVDERDQTDNITGLIDNLVSAVQVCAVLALSASHRLCSMHSCFIVCSSSSCFDFVHRAAA
jgi:hypothetical protein